MYIRFTVSNGWNVIKKYVGETSHPIQKTNLRTLERFFKKGKKNDALVRYDLKTNQNFNCNVNIERLLPVTLFLITILFNRL